jgi:hypothetical protein
MAAFPNVMASLFAQHRNEKMFVIKRTFLNLIVDWMISAFICANILGQKCSLG